MTRHLPIASLLFLALSPAAVLAWSGDEKPEDAEGCKDHPTVPRFPGSVLTNCELRDFDEYELPVGLDPESGDLKTRHVEGRFAHLNYENPDRASATEIVRNYQAALEKAGFKVTYEYKSKDERRWAGELTRKGRVAVDITASRANEGFVTELFVIEGKEMDQKIELDAGGMLDELNKSGKVAIYGINFDTGKATITADSAKVLEEIGKLLTTNAGLKLRVEGHTDNVGKAAANLELSKKRAAAVKDWLVKTAKVEAARLTTDGFGDTKPADDNKTDEGRAKNRRVELVKL